MTAQRHHHDKVKVVIDCSIEERAYIKMLAASKHMTISEYFLSFAKEITKNSFSAVKTSKILINKGLDADIDTGLRLEIYGWAFCFAHEDRQKMMSSSYE